MAEFFTTLFIWIGIVVVYTGLVLLIAHFCGINSRFDEEER